MRQPSLTKLLALHFAPALLIFLVYLATAGSLAGRGIPPSFTLNLIFAAVGIPVILVLLRGFGKREKGRSAVLAPVRYRERLRVWQYILLVPLFLIYAILISGVMAPISQALQDFIAPYVPAWFLDPSGVTAGAVLAPWLIFAVRLGVDGIANPIAEELYFRGYLLPRLGALGVWAPLVHGALFALAHFWQPQNIPTLAAMVIPLYYAVWYFRSLRLSVAVHCLANGLGALLWVANQ